MSKIESRSEKILITAIAIASFALVTAFFSMDPIGGFADAGSEKSGKSAQSISSAKSVSEDSVSEKSVDSISEDSVSEKSLDSVSEDSISEASAYSEYSAVSVESVNSAGTTKVYEQKKTQAPDASPTNTTVDKEQEQSTVSVNTITLSKSEDAPKSQLSEESTTEPIMPKAQMSEPKKVRTVEEKKLFFMIPVKVSTETTYDANGTVVETKKSFGSWLLSKLSL